MKTKMNFFLLALLPLSLLLSACELSKDSSKQLTALTMWHVYGAQINSPMNSIIERFNQTVGKENGVKVVVTSISNSTAIHDALVAAGTNQVGAPEVPDIFVCYPKTLEAIGVERAINWKEHFSEEELKDFVPAFLEEGTFDNRLAIFPLAKSSNALFINAEVYDRFAKDTGHSYEDLETWESTFELVEEYYKWSNGKAFFMYDDWIHFPMVSMKAFGTDIFKNNAIDWNNLYFKELMRPLLRAGIKGEVCLMPGYSTKAIMIDKAVAGVESTASLIYFKDTVTHEDNSITPLEVKAVPVPYFEDGKRVALQRGTGLVALKSTQEKEKAAALFTKWITSENINLEFVTHGGYLPVRISDFEKLNKNIDTMEFEREGFRSLYKTIVKIHDENSFMTAPSFPLYGAIEQAFPDALRIVLAQNNEIWKKSENKDEELLNKLVEQSLNQLEDTFNIKLQERM